MYHCYRGKCYRENDRDRFIAQPCHSRHGLCCGTCHHHHTCNNVSMPSKMVDLGSSSITGSLCERMKLWRLEPLLAVIGALHICLSLVWYLKLRHYSVVLLPLQIFIYKRNICQQWRYKQTILLEETLMVHMETLLCVNAHVRKTQCL